MNLLCLSIWINASEKNNKQFKTNLNNSHPNHNKISILDIREKLDKITIMRIKLVEQNTQTSKDSLTIIPVIISLKMSKTATQC